MIENRFQRRSYKKAEKQYRSRYNTLIKTNSAEKADSSPIPWDEWYWGKFPPGKIIKRTPSTDKYEI